MANSIRFLVLDVDGTLTDGGMYYSDSGDEFKRFHTRDGMAMKRLARQGLPLGMLSNGLGRTMVQRRAEMLGVRFVHVGGEAKLGILDDWRERLGLAWEDIAYVGDDVNDWEVMRRVGLSACPADAHETIRELADVVLERGGGQACVREFIDRFADRFLAEGKV